MRMYLLFIVSISLATLYCHGGTITYPAIGNIDLEQGTIEFWIMPEFDPVRMVKHESHNLVSIEQDHENYLGLIYKMEGKYSGLYATLRNKGIKFTPCWAFIKNWKAGEKHHVAYCWGNKKNWWIVDGKKMLDKYDRPYVVEQFQNLEMSVSKQLNIIIGKNKHAEKLIIDDLRISSIPREENEVGFHSPGKLKIDPYTLLLDTFDETTEKDGIKITKPAIMTSIGEQKGGLIDSDCMVVEGVAGKGVRF